MEKLVELLIQMRRPAEVSAHGILLEWEDAIQHQHSAEKEWLYLRGVKRVWGCSRRLSII
jgi:hypothetical protein